MRFWFKKKPAENPYDLLQPTQTDASAPATGSVPTPTPAVTPTTSTGSVPTATTGSVPLQPTVQAQVTGSVPMGSVPTTSAGSVPLQPTVQTSGSVPTTSTGSVPTTPSHKRDRKEFYYGLMNALYDAVLVLDGNGHITDCSERVVSVLARTREELWDLSISEIIPSIDAKILKQMQDGLHGKRRVLLNARCRRGDGSLFPAEIGAGLMNLIGECLVLTIRNVEKRTPVKAVIHAPAQGDRPPAAPGDSPHATPPAQGDRPPSTPGDSPHATPPAQGDRPHATPGDSPRAVIGDSPRMAVFRTPAKARALSV